MWSDNETIIDLLGFKIHSNFLRSIVTKTNLLPLTVGLFGDWGSGKTSVMKMLERELLDYEESSKEAKKVVCLYFNGWVFEGYDDAKSAIISSILIQLSNHKYLGPKLKDSIISLLKSVNWMRVISLGIKKVAVPIIASYFAGDVGLLPILMSSVNAIPENIETVINKKIEEKIPEQLVVSTFRDRFAQMIKESDIKCLIILIDDLDRCSPERIIDNLEAIKLFLSVEKTAFIIGADPRIMEHAIELMFRLNNQNPEKSDLLVKDYLEKLIQIPYNLPRLSPSEIESYITLLFCQKELESTKFELIIKAFQKQRENNPHATFDYKSIEEAIGKGEIPEALLVDIVLCNNVAPLITEGLKGNPRQVKRFLNSFNLRKELAVIAGIKNIRDDVLVKLMILEYVKSEEYLELFNWQVEGKGFPQQIINLEEITFKKLNNNEIISEIQKFNSKWSASFILKWLKMEPKLSNIDLCDYFWISRDKLKSTFSEVSFISRYVRILFDELINPLKNKIALDNIAKLQPNEINELLEILKKHIIRYPNQESGFIVLTDLMERDTPGSLEMVSSLLREIPSTNIHPGFATRLITFIKSHSKAEYLNEELKKLVKDNSKFGRALKSLIN